jgi:hypothetical protein
MTVAQDIEALVAKRPGLTEAEIARELFGGEAYQQRVNSTCRRLIREGRLQRSGNGGVADPFTYKLGSAVRARRT